MPNIVKTIPAPQARDRLGVFLIWVGVFAWLPFIVLRIAGAGTSFLWFLPFHVLGVVGGSRLRAAARREMGIGLPKKNWFYLAGHSLVILGILAWLPYVYARLIARQAVEAADYLPFHLAGVVGGMASMGIGYVIDKRKM